MGEPNRRLPTRRRKSATSTRRHAHPSFRSCQKLDPLRRLTDAARRWKRLSSAARPPIRRSSASFAAIPASETTPATAAAPPTTAGARPSRGAPPAGLGQGWANATSRSSTSGCGVRGGSVGPGQPHRRNFAMEPGDGGTGSPGRWLGPSGLSRP